jgi:hypothetical protein
MLYCHGNLLTEEMCSVKKIIQRISEDVRFPLSVTFCLREVCTVRRGHAVA